VGKRSGSPPQRGQPGLPAQRKWPRLDADGLAELRHAVNELRRANQDREARRPFSPDDPPARRRRSKRARSRKARSLALAIAVASTAVLLTIIVRALFAGPASFPLPSRAALAGLNARQRIVAIAESQSGYTTDPSSSYCNKFSAYWGAGTPDCPSGLTSEEWCADFAAWTWREAGIQFSYAYVLGDINGAAASFYEWGVAHGTWHPASSGYIARPGDVAVYGLSVGVQPSATHVAIVTADQRGQPGPDVVNGDGDRTSFSAVETARDQRRVHADGQIAPLAGYVSPP
jgi:CHAP domain